MNDEIIHFMDEVIRAAAEVCGISPDDMKTLTRRSEVVMARYLAFRIVRDKTIKLRTAAGNPIVSIEVIGSYVADRSHTDVRHALKTVKLRLGEDPKVKADPVWVDKYETIMAVINNKFIFGTLALGSFFPYNKKGYERAREFLYDLGEYALRDGGFNEVVYNANKILNKYRTC